MLLSKRIYTKLMTGSAALLMLAPLALTSVSANHIKPQNRIRSHRNVKIVRRHSRAAKSYRRQLIHYTKRSRKNLNRNLKRQRRLSAKRLQRERAIRRCAKVPYRRRVHRHNRPLWSPKYLPSWLQETRWYNKSRYGHNYYNQLHFYRRGYSTWGRTGNKSNQKFRTWSVEHPENLKSTRIPKLAHEKKTLNWFEGENGRQNHQRYFYVNGWYGATGSQYHLADHNRALVTTAGGTEEPSGTYYSNKALANQNYSLKNQPY